MIRTTPRPPAPRRSRPLADDHTRPPLIGWRAGPMRRRSAQLEARTARRLALAERRARAAYARIPDEPSAFDPAQWATADEALRRPFEDALERSLAQADAGELIEAEEVMAELQ